MSALVTFLPIVTRPAGFRPLFLAAVLVLLIVGSPASAQFVYRVQNTSGDLSVGSLFRTLQSANQTLLDQDVVIDFSLIQEAAEPGTAVIEMENGLLIERRMTWTASPELPRPVIRRASGRRNLVIVGGGVDGLVEFSHLRFENGYPSITSSGGAIDYTQNSPGHSVQMRLVGCEFFGNTVGDEVIENRLGSAAGGAVSFVASSFEPVVSSLVIEDCRFEANRALAQTSPEGSALSVEKAGLVVRDSVFIGNVGTGQLGNGGGALRVVGNRASAVIERCLFEGNESTGASALWLRRSSVPVDAAPDELRDLSFLSNTGHGGAALFQGVSTPRMPVRLRNCTFADNTGHLGTAMTLQSTSMEMHHCTISGNIHRDRNGSAVLIPLDGNSDLLISRTVVAGNRHGGNDQNDLYSADLIRIVGTVTSQGYNFIGSNNGLSGVFNGPDDLFGNNASPLNPMLARPGNYGGPVPTMPPLVESPLVDGMPGPAASFVLLDARGVTRPAGVRGDIGAVELPRVPYADWQLQIPLSANRAKNIDPDGDGLTNLLEYLFDTDPNEGSPSPVRMVQTEEGWFVDVRRSSRVRPAFFSLIRLDASTGLLDWQPAGINPVVSPYEEGSIDLFRYRYPVDPLAEDFRFFRMVAE